MTDRQKEFLLKLKALLEEYDMAIGCDIEGDTHGVNESMIIEENNTVFYRQAYSAYLFHQDITIN